MQSCYREVPVAVVEDARSINRDDTYPCLGGCNAGHRPMSCAIVRRARNNSALKTSSINRQIDPDIATDCREVPTYCLRGANGPHFPTIRGYDLPHSQRYVTPHCRQVV